MTNLRAGRAISTGMPLTPPRSRGILGRCELDAPKAIRPAADILLGLTMDIIIFLLIGLIAGWLAGQLVKGGGFGMIGDLIVGVIGALIGGYLLPFTRLSFGAPILDQIVTATIGAVILLLIVRLVKRA
jgi:uncharacterized membrane protein YeaQ/YmgE (transglycosylase-associated protein family)